MENRSKLRILYLYQYLVQNTTSEQPASTVELTKMLRDEYGIDVSRNTISDDLAMLCAAQFQIKMIRSTQNKYYYDGQAFDIPEMKLLIDAVLSSRFITERKSEVLVNKLLSLVQQDDAFKLRRHIYASNRVRSENECGYLIVDAINDAIDTRHKIAFYYTDLDVAKNRHLVGKNILSVHMHSFGTATSIISMVFATTETHCVHFAQIELRAFLRYYVI